MPTAPNHQALARELEDLLRLQTAPIAVKMIASEDEIPSGAVRPGREGHHYAQ